MPPRAMFRRAVPAVMRFAFAALVLQPAIAAGQTQPDRYVAPSNETVTTTTRLEQKFGGSSYKIIQVQNKSTVPIQVYSVTLLNCANIRQDCNEPVTVNVRVAPGRQELLYRVEPCDAEMTFSFRYTIEWRADTAGVVAPGSGSGANVASIVRLRVEPDSLLMRVGQRVALHEQVHVIGLDVHGNAVGPVQAYGVQLVASPIVTIEADTITARSVGRSAIEFQITSSRPPLTVKLPIIVSGDGPQ